MTTCSVVWIDSVVWVDSVCSVVWIDSVLWVDSVVWIFFLSVCVCVLSGFVQHPLVDPFGYDRLRIYYFRVYSGWSRLYFIPSGRTPPGQPITIIYIDILSIIEMMGPSRGRDGWGYCRDDVVTPGI